MSENPIPEIITSTGVPALIETVRDFFEKLAGPAAEEIGLLVGDRVREYRVRNQVSIMNRARMFLADAGLEPTSVPLRTLAPLLEGASLEEDESLQDLWAALLANAATEDGAERVPPAFPEIMRQVSPREARILQARFVAFARFPFPPGVERGRPESWDLGLDRAADLGISVVNLVRLGLVEWDNGLRYRLSEVDNRLESLEKQLQVFAEALGEGAGSIGLSPGYVGPPGEVALTPLGTAFLRSCLPPLQRPVESPVGTEDDREANRIWSWVAGGLAKAWAGEELLAAELTQSANEARDMYFRLMSSSEE